MKKLVKIGSMLTMAGVVLLSSGCSCSLKQGKVNERTQALMETELDYAKDFTLKYKITTTQEQEDGSVNVVEVSHTMTRIAEGNVFEFVSVAKNGKQGEELQEDASNSQTVKMYADGSGVKVKVDETVIDTNYQSSYYAFQDTALLVKDKKIKYDYYKIMLGSFDDYKITPFHACSESGDKDQIPYAVGAYKHSETTCKAKKKLFGKEATYEVAYRVSISEFRNVTIKADKENKLISAVEKNTIAVPEQKPKYETVEFIVG